MQHNHHFTYPKQNPAWEYGSSAIDAQSNAPFINTKAKKKKKIYLTYLAPCEQNSMTQKLTEPKESGSISSWNS